MLDDGHTSSGMPSAARCASSAGSCAELVPWPIRSAPSSRSDVPDRLAARSSRRRAGRCAGRPRGRRRSAAGTAAAVRRSPARRARTRPARRGVVERVVEGGVGGGQPALAGDVVDPAQHQPEVALGGDPRVLDRLGVGLDRRPPPGTDVYGVQVSSAYRRFWPCHVAGDLVGQQPDVLGRADQVDDREVDLDEVGEVAELEERPQRVRVAGHDAGVARGQLARRSAARRTRRGGRAARPWAGRR